MRNPPLGKAIVIPAKAGIHRGRVVPLINSEQLPDTQSRLHAFNFRATIDGSAGANEGYALLQDTAYVIGIIRDVLLIFVLAFIGVALYVTYRKLSSVLDSVDGTLKSTKEVADAISERFSESTSSGGSMASGIGKVIAFLLRRSRADS